MGTVLAGCALSWLAAGCATLGWGRKEPPPPPPEPVLRISVAPVLDLRTQPEGSQFLEFASPNLPPESEEIVVGRDVHRALVDWLRAHGHQPSTGKTGPGLITISSEGTRSLPATLPASQLEAEVDGVLLCGISRADRKNGEQGGEQRVIELALALYRARDGAPIWSRRASWEHLYPTAPDPADLADDLLDGLLQRAVPKEEEEGPLPLLHGFPPALPPPPPPPPQPT